MHATDYSFFYISVIFPKNWVSGFTVKVFTLHLSVACQLLHVFHVFRACTVMFTTMAGTGAALGSSNSYGILYSLYTYKENRLVQQHDL